MSIASRNSILVGDISEIDGIAIASIGSINGIELSSAIDVYAFLDLAGTIGAAMTPEILNDSMKGAIPGTWSRGAGKHSGVQSDPVATLTHTVVGSVTYDLNPPVSCNGEEFTAAARSIQNDQGLAPDPTDWEQVKWTPGEVIAENFMACFRYECNRSLGADTNLSIDVVALAFGGNGGIFQVQMDASGIVARTHGGQTIPLANNVRYKVELLCDLTGERVDLSIGNDSTGAFVGSCGIIYTDGIDLNRVDVGDYLTNGNGTQDVSGIYFQKGAAAVFSSFPLDAVTDLAFVQNGIGAGIVSFNSKALSFLIERSDDGGAFSTIEANYYSPRASINDPVQYTDSGIPDLTSVEYRVTAKVRQIESDPAISDPVVIDDSSQPIYQDDFDDYTPATNLGGQGNWIEVGGGIQVLKPGIDGYVTTASGGVIGNCYYNQPISANMRVEATIKTVAAGGGFDWVGPGARTQAGSNTGYGLVFSSTDLYLISIVAGTQATIMSDSAMTLAVGNKLAIEVTGVGAATRIKVQVDTGSGWVDKWTDVNPAADIDGGFASTISWLLSGTNAIDDWKAFEI